MYRSVGVNEAKRILKQLKKEVREDAGDFFYATNSRESAIWEFSSSTDREKFINSKNIRRLLPLTPIEGRFLNDVLDKISNDKTNYTKFDRMLAKKANDKLKRAGWND